MKITIVNPNLSGCPSIFEIGLTYLATYINERTNHEAVTLDFTFHRKDWKKHLHKHMEKHKPDVIGFGTPTMYLNYIMDMIKEIHKYKADIPIICGGYHPTLEPADTLGREGVTAICLGDGEETLAEYMDALEGKVPMNTVKGIYYNDNGQIIKNELRPKMDISKLPYPDYDVWEDRDKYFFFLNQLYTIGMRGCPYNCTNCSDQPFHMTTPGSRVRILTPERYVDEIEYQWHKYPNKFQIVHCYDPTFTFDHKWVSAFCKEWKKRGLNEHLAFSVFARGELLPEKTIKVLADANCKIVRIGVETGSEELRKEVLHKNVTNAQIETAVALLHKYKIAVTAFNMLGIPSSTKKDVIATGDFMDKLGIDRPVFFIFRPFAGTEAAGMMGESIINWKRMQEITSLHKGAVLELKDMTQKEIERYQTRCYFHFAAKRCIRMIKISKHMFFINWMKYLVKGLHYQVPLFYIMGYFLHNFDKNGVN